MTFTDIVILLFTLTISGFIMYRLFKHKDESSCERCSYGKRMK